MKAEQTGLGGAERIRAGQYVPRRLSSIFDQLARDAEGSVTVDQIRIALGDRSFAALLVFFAALNMLPLPPGSTLVLGLPLLLLSIQMLLGRNTVWLPQFVLSKSIDATQFRQMSERFLPRIRQAERIIRPRYWPFSGKQAERIIGGFTFILATAVTLPIPLGNWFPAFSCAIVGLALSERDGVLLGAGLVVGILSLVLIGAVVGAAGVLAGMVFF